MDFGLCIAEMGGDSWNYACTVYVRIIYLSNRKAKVRWVLPIYLQIGERSPTNQVAVEQE